MRIGFASDVHKLVMFRPLILGGVKVPSPYGELAHSDGDVVYHALAESILGALALGDLGSHFPDTDPAYKDIDSSYFVREVMKFLEEDHYEISNIDISITLNKPKLREYIDEMRANIAALTKVSIDRVSVKAGTNENIHPEEERNVKAECIILLMEK